MRIFVYGSGRKLPNWAGEAIGGWQKRFGHGYEVRFVWFKNTDADRVEAHYARVLTSLKAKGRVCALALDARVENWASAGWAKHLRAWREEGVEVALFIGAHAGFSAPFLAHMDKVVSFGSQTLSHSLAHVVLCEQLYRAYSMVQGLPYHRE